MKAFKYHAPKSVDHAIDLLKGADENTHVIAGGTDIIIQINQKMIKPEMIVDLKQIDELKYIKEEDGLIKIGALTNFTAIERSEIVRGKAKVLSNACGEVGSPQIRNLGTIGGNVVNASAAGDSITALMALDASLVLRSSEGERVMKIQEFYEGEGNSQIRKDEILSEIFFVSPNDNTLTSFTKLGKRKALAIVVLSSGIVLELEDDRKTCKDVRISLGAISRYSMRARNAEEKLIGKELTEENIDSCVNAISEMTYDSVYNSPFQDLASYKGTSIKGVVRKTFTDILERI